MPRPKMQEILITMATKISRNIAKQLAIGFYSEIPNFIAEHLEEYKTWLIKTGNTDETIKFSNTTEAAEQ